MNNTNFIIAIHKNNVLLTLKDEIPNTVRVYSQQKDATHLSLFVPIYSQYGNQFDAVLSDRICFPMI